MAPSSSSRGVFATCSGVPELMAIRTHRRRKIHICDSCGTRTTGGRCTSPRELDAVRLTFILILALTFALTRRKARNAALGCKYWESCGPAPLPPTCEVVSQVIHDDLTEAAVVEEPPQLSLAIDGHDKTTTVATADSTQTGETTKREAASSTSKAPASPDKQRKSRERNKRKQKRRKRRR